MFAQIMTTQAAFRCLLVAALGLSGLGRALAEPTLADRIQNGDLEGALALVEHGADVNAAQPDGTTPLHWAVYKLDVPLVEALLARGANASAANDFGSTPLAEAVKAAQAGLVARLLEAGADPESRNQDGETALMLAARAGSLDIAKRLVARLLEAGADP
ncbi:MAG TPA: ankyrin repeat domain-containing protein, partial [Gammaproteobacteria bacterium]|nr:ankyrin repeat domain-containing protein [Gammaproteobacteria bacterium]